MQATPSNEASSLIPKGAEPTEPEYRTAHSRQISPAERLLTAGITPDLLMSQWGVILWSIKYKEARLKLKMEACRPVDEEALQSWFTAKLGTQELSIQFSPITKCCQKPCNGCLAGNQALRGEWITSDHEQTKQR